LNEALDAHRVGVAMLHAGHSGAAPSPAWHLGCEWLLSHLLGARETDAAVRNPGL